MDSQRPRQAEDEAAESAVVSLQIVVTAVLAIIAPIVEVGVQTPLLRIPKQSAADTVATPGTVAATAAVKPSNPAPPAEALVVAPAAVVAAMAVAAVVATAAFADDVATAALVGEHTSLTKTPRQMAAVRPAIPVLTSRRAPAVVVV